MEKLPKIERKPVNFQALIGDLFELRKWTHRSVGAAVGVSSNSIANLKKKPNSEPLHTTGQALIELHEQEFGTDDH